LKRREGGKQEREGERGFATLFSTVNAKGGAGARASQKIIRCIKSSVCYSTKNIIIKAKICIYDRGDYVIFTWDGRGQGRRRQARQRRGFQT
jgi:hypothetical protein